MKSHRIYNMTHIQIIVLSCCGEKPNFRSWMQWWVAFMVHLRAYLVDLTVFFRSTSEPIWLINPSFLGAPGYPLSCTQASQAVNSPIIISIKLFKMKQISYSISLNKGGIYIIRTINIVIELEKCKWIYFN